MSSTCVSLDVQGTLHLPEEESAALRALLDDVSCFVLETMAALHDKTPCDSLLLRVRAVPLQETLASVGSFLRKEVALVLVPADRGDVDACFARFLDGCAECCSLFLALASLDDIRQLCSAAVDVLSAASSVLQSVDAWHVSACRSFVAKLRELTRGLLSFKKASPRAVGADELTDVLVLADRLVANLTRFLSPRATRCPDPDAVLSHVAALAPGVVALREYVCGSGDADAVRRFCAAVDAVEEDVQVQFGFGIVVRFEQTEAPDADGQESEKQRPRAAVRAQRQHKQRGARYRELLNASQSLAAEIARMAEVVGQTTASGGVDEPICTWTLAEMKERLLGP